MTDQIHDVAPTSEPTEPTEATEATEPIEPIDPTDAKTVQHEGRVSEKRRALGRGLGALIPSGPHSARPVDVFFRDAPDHASAQLGHAGHAGHPAFGRTERTENDRVGDDRLDDDRLGDDRAERHDTDASVFPPAADEPSGVSRETEDGTTRGEGHQQSAATDAPSWQDALAPVPGAVFAELPVSAIRPNPKQPRTIFDEDDLAELAHSIKEIGVLQPIVVRRVSPEGTETAAADADAEGPGDGELPETVAPAAYELIMGERRLRATQLAGLDTIPAIVKDTQDDDLLRDALLENLHRSQLNPLEEAAAYQQLLDDFGCSHEELATRIGRSRPQISNTLRLLRLPPLVARRLAAGVLSAGHARALLGLDDRAAMERLAQRIVAEGLSVRSVEEIVSLGGGQAPRPRRVRAGTRHPQLDDLSARLSDRLDTRVSIALGQRKGKLTVEFASVEDLNRIVSLLGERVDEPAVNSDER